MYKLLYNSALTLVCLLPLACAVDDTELTPTDDVDVAVVNQPWTGSNPSIDAEFMGEIDAPPEGMTYLDFAYNGTTYYVTRSDGQLRRYSGGYNPVFQGYPAGTYHRLEYVDTSYSGWALISTNDATKKIRKNSQTYPSNIGNYPAGVTSISNIAARLINSGGLKLDIWITYSEGGVTKLRAGQYSVTTGVLTWEATAKSFGMYNLGLTYGSLPNNSFTVFSVINYTGSKFVWYTPPNLTATAEANFSYTDHAYLHSEGAYDRFAPDGLHYYRDGYFYGLDSYYNSATGRRGWVIARIPKSAIKP